MPTFRSLFLAAFIFLTTSLAYPFPRQTGQQPFFPDTPASCPICAQSYPSINSCAQASTVLANVSSVLFNPGAFIDVIRCSCTDTFQSAFPQCVDCFEKTNQTAVLDTPDLPSLVDSIRQVCSFASSVLGNVSNSNGETSPSYAGSVTTTSATASSTSGAPPGARLSTTAAAVVVALIVFFGASLL